MSRYQGAFLALALVATAAHGQARLHELRWADGGAARGGVIRCDPGQDVQLSLEGEDASMDRVSLALYAPAVQSSDPSVARVAASSSYAHIVNVRCVGDGEAWLTAETVGKRAHLGVLVGSAKGQAGMGQPRPETASAAVVPAAASPTQPESRPVVQNQPAGSAAPVATAATDRAQVRTGLISRAPAKDSRPTTTASGRRAAEQVVGPVEGRDPSGDLRRMLPPAGGVALSKSAPTMVTLPGDDPFATGLSAPYALQWNGGCVKLGGNSNGALIFNPGGVQTAFLDASACPVGLTSMHIRTTDRKTGAQRSYTMPVAVYP